MYAACGCARFFACCSDKCRYAGLHSGVAAYRHHAALPLSCLPVAAGVALYNSFLKTVPLKKMLLGAMLLGTGLGSTQLLLISGANRALGLSDEIFVLGDSVILTALGQVWFHHHPCCSN